ncbi:GNAT family N-acetyltransferase [Chitinophaga sp. 30R24]|uniref:GNAT family N-acetyltransferase n=1 Tax=Chitinophaga sp. 30R24 TaxID=3248838 RepID=UPI003B8EC65B
MEKMFFNNNNLRETALQLNFSILINNACRELNNNSYYDGIPRYDPVLAEHFNATGHTLHLKFNFPESSAEVYVPLKYAAVTRRHQYDFPVVERNTTADSIAIIGPERFLELVAAHARLTHEQANAAYIQQRLHNSIDNIATFLTHFQETGKVTNKAEMTFIEAEQLLPAGHTTHALSKSREGFSVDDLLQYSPETGGRFQLHYFLLHPELVIEQQAKGQLPSGIFRDHLNEYTKKDNGIQSLLNKHADWKVTLTHPWEANYLLEDATVKELIAKGLLYNLGAWGPLFTATSSVRTVYHEESNWMYKFSLHVKITSAVRINYLHELQRGYQVSCLLATPQGQQLQEENPTVAFTGDPAFIAVVYEGKVIDGFSTALRENQFMKERATLNVGLLASFCQDALPGQVPRIVNVIEGVAARALKPIEQAAEEWFTRYLRLLLEPVLRIFNHYGLACEPHQQNTLLELDSDLFPVKVYFRDNQSFLFRKAKQELVAEMLPSLIANNKDFLPDERLFELLTHYLVISNLVGLINVMGANGLAEEDKLLQILYRELESLVPGDESGFADYLLKRRYWMGKANLLTALCNIDGGETPAAVAHMNYPNVLHRNFFSRQLIDPEGKEVIYSRYFPKEEVVISIRPIDLDRDLEMLHEWFNREHAIKIWQMNWPIRQLEHYYRTLLPGEMMYSYIGEANGEPTFNIEVYWAIRDMVGDYYDVLPTDYGTHQFIAPVDPKKKYASPSTQCMVDYVFAQPEVGKMVGEGAVDSLASMMNKAHVGFKIEKVIEMPHKRANLNFCYREWYWAKFPQNKDILITPVAEVPVKEL